MYYYDFQDFHYCTHAAFPGSAIGNSLYMYIMVHIQFLHTNTHIHISGDVHTVSSVDIG